LGDQTIAEIDSANRLGDQTITKIDSADRFVDQCMTGGHLDTSDRAPS
jgi:hypothetical protein